MAASDKKLTITDMPRGVRPEMTVEAGAYWISVRGPHEAHFRREPTNRRHRHTYYEVCIVRQGSGLFTHGTKKYSLRTGDLFISQPGIFHEISSFRTKDLILDFCSFGLTPRIFEGASEASRIITAFLEYPLIHRRNCSFLGKQFRAVASLDRLQGSDQGYFRLNALRHLALLTMHLLTNPVAPEKYSHAQKEAHGHHIDKALEFISAHLNRNLEVVELARHCGMSERNLRRLFLAAFGHSVHHEIQTRRCLRAKSLLSMGDFSIKECALQLGIESPAQFTRWFTRWAGCTPRAYRQRSSTVFLKAPGIAESETEFLKPHARSKMESC